MTGLAQNLSFILLGEDKSASSTMTAAQSTAEKVTGAIGGSFQKLGGIVGGEFGEILDKAGSGIEELGAKGAKLSTTLAVGGGVIAAAGVGLMQLGSGEVQASAQLATAIKNTGKSYEDFGTQIEEVIAKEQNFDHSALDTKAALTTLTTATGSTKTALAQMNVVSDLAAAKHISLADAAQMVAKILNGTGGKALSAYGITMEKVVDPTKALASAQKEVTDAASTLEAAQKRLAQLQEIDAGKKKLTISDHIALANAQDAVTKASNGLNDAQTKLNNTSTVAITKTQAGKDALDQLSKKLDGQAKSSVNNFGSQVDIAKTKIVDWVEEMAGPAGEALSVIGTISGIAGTALSFLQQHQQAAAAAALERAAAEEAAAAATDEEAASMVGLDAAMDANPIGLVAGALGGLAAIIGGSLLIDGTKSNTAAVQGFTSALREDNDAIGANTRAYATNALVKDGALKTAGQYGIAASLVVDAALGEAGAQAELNGKLQEASVVYQQASDGSDTYISRTVGLSASQRQAKADLDALKASVGDTNQSLNDSLTNQRLYNAGMNDTAANASRAASAVHGLYSGILAIPSSVSTKFITEWAPTTVGKTSGHAAGGIVTRPTSMDVVGESGPEAVIPLNAGILGALGGGGGTTNNFYIEAGISSPNDIAKSISTLILNATKTGAVSKQTWAQISGAAA